MTNFTKPFTDISFTDIGIVDDNNANLGHIVDTLSFLGIKMPNGFAIAPYAYKYFLDYNKIKQPLHQLMLQVNTHSFNNIHEISNSAKALIMETPSCY
jgi:pyruvate, water dikinase